MHGGDLRTRPATPGGGGSSFGSSPPPKVLLAAAALVAGSNERVSIKVGLVEVDVHGDR